MTFEAGAKLGGYEVVAHLGAGGMGEVSRTRDSKLGRDVALKILPEGFAPDPERLTRFEREEQILASLNHPNTADSHLGSTSTPYSEPNLHDEHGQRRKPRPLGRRSCRAPGLVSGRHHTSCRCGGS